MYSATILNRNSPLDILLKENIYYEDGKVKTRKLSSLECRLQNAGSDVLTFEVITIPNEKQQCAYDLLKNIIL